jgi:hypothetical protein
VKKSVAVRAALLCMLALAAAGCAGTIKNMREVPPDAAAPAPAPGKALVVFMRPSGFAAGIQSSVFSMKEDKPQIVGILAAKAKVAWQADPGMHLFMVVGESGDFMTADLVAGRTYYALITPRMGVWKARFSLAPISKPQLGIEEFKEWFDTTRWVAPDESTAAWGHDNYPSIQEKFTAYYPKWMEKAPADRPALLSNDGM